MANQPSFPFPTPTVGRRFINFVPGGGFSVTPKVLGSTSTPTADSDADLLRRSRTAFLGSNSTNANSSPTQGGRNVRLGFTPGAKAPEVQRQLDLLDTLKTPRSPPVPEKYNKPTTASDVPTPVKSASADLKDAAGGIANSVIGGNIVNTIGSVVSGITGIAGSIHHDNTIQSMKNQDIAAAHSVGLVSPDQLANSNYGVMRGSHIQSAQRAVGTSSFST